MAFSFIQINIAYYNQVKRKNYIFYSNIKNVIFKLFYDWHEINISKISWNV